MSSVLLSYKIYHILFISVLFYVVIHNNVSVMGTEREGFMYNVSEEEDDYWVDENDNIEGCYEDNMNPYLYFSTKTSYKSIVQEEQEIVKPPPGCSPAMIWSIIRHGVRYSVQREEFYELYKIRDEILYNHDKKRSVNLCNKDIENLRKWYFTMPEGERNKIHENGIEEARVLADRLSNKFSQLLKPSYVPGRNLNVNNKMMQVTNTTSDKTLICGQEFMEALFPNNPKVVVLPPLPDDLMVQIYTPCINRMTKQLVKTNLENYYETDTFKVMQYMVTTRLGLQSLTAKQLELMYKMCTYDKAWNYDKVSPWCAVFTESDLKVLEFFQDYKYSIKSGYGSEELSKNLGCPLVRDLLIRFKELNDGKASTQPDAQFYMAHSTTLNTLLVALGLAKDRENLTATNYGSQQERKWRTSLNGPFGANFVAVFYRCDYSSNKVITYLNEKPIQIPGCEGIICTFDLLYDRFEDFIKSKNCNVKKLCKEEHSTFWFYVLLCGCIVAGLVFVLKLLFDVLYKKQPVMAKLTRAFKRDEEKKHMV